MTESQSLTDYSVSRTLKIETEKMFVCMLLCSKCDSHASRIQNSPLELFGSIYCRDCDWSGDTMKLVNSEEIMVPVVQ